MSDREAAKDTPSMVGFDQTNGLAQGLEGESDGTADGEEASAAERDGTTAPNVLGQRDDFRTEVEGADDGRDPNP